MNASAQYGRFGSGKAVRRVEDESLLTGRGNFADDVNARILASLSMTEPPVAERQPLTPTLYRAAGEG